MSKVKVNLGAGPSGINGWVNFDWGMLPFLAKNRWIRKLLVSLGVLGEFYNVEWPDFIMADIRKKLPLKNKSVDFVYCSHVLEHFDKYQVLNILKECKRVLRKGGVLRVLVPDINKIIEIYNKNKNADEFSDLIWGFDKSNLNKTILDKFKERFIRGHKWSYDVNSMTDLLIKAGFNKVFKEKFRKGKTPDLEKLELAGHKRESLYLEASKI